MSEKENKFTLENATKLSTAANGERGELTAEELDFVSGGSAKYDCEDCDYHGKSTITGRAQYAANCHSETTGHSVRVTEK